MSNLGKVLRILHGTLNCLSLGFTSCYYFATFTLPFPPPPSLSLSLFLSLPPSLSFRTSKFIGITPFASEYFSMYFLFRKYIHLRKNFHLNYYTSKSENLTLIQYYYLIYRLI